MRVLHVNKYLYRRGGAESYMDDVAALQRRAGATVEMFGMQHSHNEDQRFADYFPREFELDPAPTSLTDRASAVVRLFWNTEAARGMRRTLDSFQPDVAHLHNIYHHLSPSILRPLRADAVRTVMTLHDYKLACPTYRFLDQSGVCQACLGGHFRQAVRRRCKDGSVTSSALLALELRAHTTLGAYDWLSTLICPSRFMFDTMVAAGVYPDKLVHIPHFIDLRDRRPVSDTPHDGPIVFAGRLSPEKGVDTLIRAMAVRTPTQKLVIAGEGPERGALEELASRSRVDAQFVGRLGGSEMGGLLSAASVVVMPSVWFENQPMIVLEAFGAGRPVIGTALGGTPELITDGVDGAIVEPGDHQALSAALHEVLSDGRRLVEMGRAGRAKVEADFGPEQHLEAISRVYAGTAV